MHNIYSLTLINFSLDLNVAYQLVCVQNTFKQTVDYYTTRGSHVFVCFIDFNKAFDNVSHIKLFSKLLDDNVNCVIVIGS